MCAGSDKIAYILVNHVPATERKRILTIYQINYINLSYLLVSISIIIIVRKNQLSVLRGIRESILFIY